jgi:hypothetical protein
VDSISYVVTGLYQFTLSFQTHYGSAVGSASIRNEYQESFSAGKARQTRMVDFTEICVPII